MTEYDYDHTASESLTKQFYEWEARGRGWFMSYAYPVELEPPFQPFYFHTVKPLRRIDDSRVPGLFESIGNLFKKKEPASRAGLYERPVVEMVAFECEDALRVYSVVLPKGFKVSVPETEHFLVMLSYCRYPISFEIVAAKGKIALQFTCREFDAFQLTSQLKGYFPGCIVEEKEDLISSIINSDQYLATIDYGLQDEFMCPLLAVNNFNLDPFIALFSALGSIEEDEHIAIQILFKGAVKPWAESIMRSVTGNEGKSFFVNAPEMQGLAKEKIASPLFGTIIRVLSSSPTEYKAIQLAQHTGKAFVRLYKSDSNSLEPLYDECYTVAMQVEDIELRQTHRTGMLLSAQELLTFVHLPSDSVENPALQRDIRKTKAAPAITEGHATVLGINEHQGKVKEVTVSNSQRLKHTHIIGATGTGKSTLLHSLIVQDIENGNGLCLLDPHGDLIDAVIGSIPEGRVKDVVIIDPSDSEYPVGLNFLTAHSDTEKDILSSDLVAVFRRLSTSWGDQMNSVFANAILAFLESSKGGTLVDLRRFLIEKSFRDSFLKTVQDPNVVYYWEKEYPMLKSSSIGSILTRLDTFLRPKVIRNMVAQQKSLDFGKLLDMRKIILVKLSQGLIGAENSYLLGTVIVSKIHQAAMARQMQAKENRSDFFLYVDEFQNFIAPSMASILSGARKYHLGLILAHQDMQQLMKQDSELASAVMSNVGTRICFRVGDTDAKKFADGFSFFEPKDLQSLNTGEAIARVDRSDYDFSLSTIPLPTSDIPHTVRESILSHSRAVFGTPKEQIEVLLPQGQGTPKILHTEKVEEVQQEVKPASIPIPVLTTTSQAETTEKLVKQKEITEHRYLQTLIKRMAEMRGYKANIEEPICGGKGRVDVSLERNGKRIACEIAMTTGVEWEIHNIKKCLEAGYDLVVECSTDKMVLENIRERVVRTLSKSLHEKVLMFDPEALFSFLDAELVKEASTEKRIKGYRVKVAYNPASTDVMDKKRETVGKVIIDAIQGIKKK